MTCPAIPARPFPRVDATRKSGSARHRTVLPLGARRKHALTLRAHTLTPRWRSVGGVPATVKDEQSPRWALRQQNSSSLGKTDPSVNMGVLGPSAQK